MSSSANDTAGLPWRSRGRPDASAPLSSTGIFSGLLALALSGLEVGDVADGLGEFCPDPDCGEPDCGEPDCGEPVWPEPEFFESVGVELGLELGSEAGFDSRGGPSLEPPGLPDEDGDDEAGV